MTEQLKSDRVGVAVGVAVNGIGVAVGGGKVGNGVGGKGVAVGGNAVAVGVSGVLVGNSVGVAVGFNNAACVNSAWAFCMAWVSSKLYTAVSTAGSGVVTGACGVQLAKTSIPIRDKMINL